MATQSTLKLLKSPPLVALSLALVAQTFALRAVSRPESVAPAPPLDWADHRHPDDDPLRARWTGAGDGTGAHAHRCHGAKRKSTSLVATVPAVRPGALS